MVDRDLPEVNPLINKLKSAFFFTRSAQVGAARYHEWKKIQKFIQNENMLGSSTKWSFI